MHRRGSPRRRISAHQGRVVAAASWHSGARRRATKKTIAFPCGYGFLLRICLTPKGLHLSGDFTAIDQSGSAIVRFHFPWRRFTGISGS